MKSLSLSVRSKKAGVVLAVAAVIGALGIPAGAGLAHADDPYDCKAGAVVIVAGTQDPDGKAMVGVAERYTGKRPVLDENGKVTIVGDETSPYHGVDDDGNTNEYKVLYAEYPTALWPLGQFGYNDDVAQGVASTKHQIAEYQANCPGRDVVVAGYSQGARVAGDVLSDIGNGRATTVLVDGQEVTISADGVRGELYSDPRRDGPESGRGIELAMAGIIPGLTMTGPRKGGFGALPVTTYCYEGDPICDLPDLLHDPFGVLDGLVGYFTKHGYYPARMWAGVERVTWRCESKDVVGGYTDCVVPAPSAIALLREDVVNQVRGFVGLAPREVIDFWGMLPNINSVFPHANLSDLQQYISPVMDLFPSLPKLGYGGYLPDLLVFTDILEGVLRLDIDQFVDGLERLGRSARSIATMPIAFVEYWGGQAKKATAPKTTSGGDVNVRAVGSSSATGTRPESDVVEPSEPQPTPEPESKLEPKTELEPTPEVEPTPESNPEADVATPSAREPAGTPEAELAAVS